MKPVPRSGRMLDLAGMVVFLIGGAIVARAWFGFRSIPDFERPETAPPFAAMELAEGFKRLQHIGVGVMVAGIAVFILAWWVARRAQRLPTEG